MFWFLQAWSVLIFSLFSLLAKHCTCQISPDQNTEALRPIFLMPAPSGISYESLHYPMPLDQYQVVPLVINTGKIPLINHAVQAPIQYFIPNGKSQRTSESYDPAQSSKLSHQQRSTTQRITKTYLNSKTENLAAHKYYPPTTIYSETHVESQPAASRYSYGYQIIDGNIGNSNDQSETSDDNNTLENFKSNMQSGSTRTQMVIEYTNMPNANTVVVHKQNVNESIASTTDSNPIVRSDTEITKTQLKKHYRNKTNLETSTNVTNQNGNLTTLKP